MNKTLLPVLCAATVVYAADVDPMAEACQRLKAVLEQEVEALASIKEPGDAAGAVEAVRASLLAQEDLFAVSEKELWVYIDNTEGVKQPLVDLLEELALQFARLEDSAYFGNEELRALLSVQIEADPAVEHAKREKVHAIDHDE